MKFLKSVKFRFPAVYLLLIFLASVSFSQDFKFELEVSLDETAIDRTESEIPATVIITNKSEKVLYTDGLGSVEFKFSKCMEDTDCGLLRNDFISQVRIPRKKLFENESFEFKTNLAEQNWSISNSAADNTGSQINFTKLPSQNIFFTANVKMLTGYRNTANKKNQPDNDKMGKRPQYNKSVSNIVTVTIE